MKNLLVILIFTLFVFTAGFMSGKGNTLVAANTEYNRPPVSQTIKGRYVTKNDFKIPRPPGQFQFAPEAHVYFRQSVDTNKLCSDWGTAQTPGMVIMACTDMKTKEMILPNPCQYDEFYAQLVCHEAAHTIGWPDPKDEDAKTVG